MEGLLQARDAVALVIAVSAAAIWLRRVVVAVAWMIAARIRLVAHEVRGHTGR